MSSSPLYVVQSTYRSLGILRAICMRENGKKVLIFLKVLETKLETHLGSPCLKELDCFSIKHSGLKVDQKLQLK